MTDHRWNHYADHRSARQIDDLLHYGHFIPVGRGLTDTYVATHFPGRTWNDLMEVWKAAGIVVRSTAGGPPRCDVRVKTVHFTDATDFAVEWEDGTVTTS
ncbi:hypothetical protein EHW97_13285 [Aeromicrobium camelliae]|uniref:Uncharacterized protein n=1 Tax=Aeromicrobium camelliae TaxID=1538144 RepID=A0A3N6WLH8_9ACTN|nr:hypothetical protein [Aeromicrobium camelliae]RQN02528.1 hypothetical protein EHW97_13285 [Aeromicrobium camelliae]